MRRLILCGLIFILVSGEEKICTSSECQSYSERLKKNIDSSVSPCDDFYKFACGNFNPEIPSEKSEIGEFSIINDKLQEQLDTIMSQKIDENDIKPLKLVKNFYQSCKNIDRINEIGIDRIVETMKTLGGWPVVKNHEWNEKKWYWQKTAQDMELIGFGSNYIFNFGLSIDLKNSTQRILVVDQPGLGISREFLIKGRDDKLVQAYHSYQIDMAILYGAEKEDAEREMSEILDFEIKLANLTLSKEERRDPFKLYNIMTVRELQEAVNCIDWVTYMNAFIEPGKKINKEEKIKVTSKEVLIKIHKLIMDTPKRTIANYMMWRLAGSTASILSEKIRDRRLVFVQTLTGVQKYQERWKECVGSTSAYLSIATSSLYVRKFFNQKSKHDALELVSMIRDEFKEILKSTEWMDDETREIALEKAEKIKNFIAYPDEIMDDEKLIEYYEDLEIDQEEFYKSILKFGRFAQKKGMRKFRQSVDKDDWRDHASVAIVNAFYNRVENSIQFPAGILQGQFFSADRPKYLNYGAIGFVIGHEITHGFDDQGRLFDGDGNLKEWWDETTRKAYLEKAQCIIEQYGNFTEPTTGLMLNGINTQGENIADNGGILMAYKAYQNWVKTHGTEPTIPGFEYTPNQHFWLSAAQSWCSKTRVETMKLRIETDPHSPASLRVNGVSGNSPDFLNDFQCPQTSKLYMQSKCKVW